MKLSSKQPAGVSVARWSGVSSALKAFRTVPRPAENAVFCCRSQLSRGPAYGTLATSGQSAISQGHWSMSRDLTPLPVLKGTPGFGPRVKTAWC